MVKVALLARLVAKAGKEEEVAAFLASALPLAQAEAATTVWFALRLSKTEFGIFDAFPNDAGRKAHLAGPIAAALMAKAGELLSEPPKIVARNVLAVFGKLDTGPAVRTGMSPGNRPLHRPSRQQRQPRQTRQDFRVDE